MPEACYSYVVAYYSLSRSPDVLVLIESALKSRVFRRDARNARTIRWQVIYETPYGHGFPGRLSTLSALFQAYNKLFYSYW